MIDRTARETGHAGEQLPGVVPDSLPLLGAPPDGGMTPLRTFLLAEELPTGPDLPPLPDGPHEESFPVYMRLVGMILLLAHHGELYTELSRLWQEEPSPDLETTAIEAANDIALVLLWMWRHLELLVAMRGTALDPTEACGTLNELYFGFPPGHLAAQSPSRAAA